MDPEYDNRTSINTMLNSTLDGLVDGIVLGFDPIGAVISYFTDIRTIGGSGYRGVNRNGKRNPNVDYNSSYYKVPKIAGTVLAVGGHIQTSGLLLILTALLDIGWYTNNKEQGKEKF